MRSVIVPTTDIMSTTESQVENSSHEEELRGTKRKISLSNCGVCGSQEAKYRCPACLAHSCSLQCVKKHKDESGCSGIRNKTAFVPLSHFDEMALLSDYRFLEDTGRFADGATRDGLMRTPRTTSKAKKLAACARKMNITLRFLPVTFTKSRENSTFFFTKEKEKLFSWLRKNSALNHVDFGFTTLLSTTLREQLFLWHLKLIFPQSSTEFSQRRVPDKQTLEQILTFYIHPTESDPVTRQKLKMYVHAPLGHVKIFMKAEGRKANSVRYHELNLHKSLKDNLSYKTLIEYPVLHVVLKDYWKDYPLKGPAEPATACGGFATKSKGVHQKEEGVIQVSPSSQQGTLGEADIWTETPETEPPKEKRAKREGGDEEPEEGELTDSSDEEKEKDSEGNTDGKASCDNSPANSTEALKEEAVDSSC